MEKSYSQFMLLGLEIVTGIHQDLPLTPRFDPNSIEIYHLRVHSPRFNFAINHF
jgi:hypothetical protein